MSANFALQSKRKKISAKLQLFFILPCENRNESLSYLMDYFANVWKFDVHGDVPRIVRTLTGRAIGLVLGGGGARGYGHIPVVQKTLSSDIPIDFVGGTSIGSFMGAIYAMWKDKDVLQQKALAWAEFMNNPLKYIYDLTWPRAAYFSGGEFNKGIHMVGEQPPDNQTGAFHFACVEFSLSPCLAQVLANRQIEDMWLPYYCITTDVSDFKKRVHTRGTAWRAVRASMTLAGYLPPICDERDGHLLLDGGYVDNLPVDIMIEQMGVRNVIAVDVGRHESRQNTNYGDVLSGWWLFWRQAVVERLWPWAQRIQVPSSMDIQARLTYLTSEYFEDLLQRTKVHVHVRPPVQEFSTMAFHLAPSIIALTRDYVEKAFHHEQYEQLKKMKQMVAGGSVLQNVAAEKRRQSFNAAPSSSRQPDMALPDENELQETDSLFVTPSNMAAAAQEHQHKAKQSKTLRSFRTFSITDLASIIAAQEIKSINSRSNSIQFIPESSTATTMPNGNIVFSGVSSRATSSMNGAARLGGQADPEIFITSSTPEKSSLSGRGTGKF